MANDSPVAAASIWLDVWERTAAEPPTARGDLLAASFRCDGSGALTLGARDALLLELRARLFGKQLRSTATCPACEERCEWDFELDALRVAPETEVIASSFELAAEDWHIAARAVTTDDLAAVAACADERSALRALLRRCVLEARHAGHAVDAGDLPDEWVERLSALLASADPQAAMSIGLACPACAHTWEAGFDIGDYLWSELDAWAQRALADVHELASRYGWSEPEILALSPARRARYLAMANA